MPRVLFFHGLEGGPHGRKSSYLRDHVDMLIVPDLDMSLLDIRKRNCPLRNPWVFAGALRHALWQSLEMCTDIAEHAYGAEPKVDLIIGSSWGGAVALKLLERNPAIVTPCILIAPALAGQGTFASFIFPRWLPSTLAQTDVTILHGTLDDEVPIEASRNLKGRFPQVKLIEIEGGDHRLKQILDDGTLLELVRRKTQ